MLRPNKTETECFEHCFFKKSSLNKFSRTLVLRTQRSGELLGAKVVQNQIPPAENQKPIESVLGFPLGGWGSGELLHPKALQNHWCAAPVVLENFFPSLFFVWFAFARVASAWRAKQDILHRFILSSVLVDLNVDICSLLSYRRGTSQENHG